MEFYSPRFGMHGLQCSIQKSVLSILQSAHLSISINGQLEGYFGCSRGVRQGDPLSLLLFAIGEDVLCRMINYAGGIRHIERIEAKMGVRVPVDFVYADDILIFCKASQGNVLLLHDIFIQYGEASGQLVSPAKSKVFFGRNVTGGFKHYFVNFVEGSLPFTYLGVPIFFGKPRVAHLTHIAERIINKFDRWSRSCLSMAGRVCLVNSMIASFTTHSIMVYHWP